MCVRWRVERRATALGQLLDLENYNYNNYSPTTTTTTQQTQ
jgi:hypothetical protein